MITAIRKFLKEEDGITALEYGVLAAIAAATIAAVFGTGASGTLNTILTNLLGAVATAAGVSAK